MVVKTKILCNLYLLYHLSILALDDKKKKKKLTLTIACQIMCPSGKPKNKI